MREIKFRLWEDGEMEYDVRFTGEDMSFNNEIIKKGSNLMQYTGLKDKEGKEIYEGDIIKQELSLTTDIIIIKDLFVFLEEKGYAEGELGQSYKPKYLKVIGNIHQNPELFGKTTWMNRGDDMYLCSVCNKAREVNKE